MSASGRSSRRRSTVCEQRANIEHAPLPARDSRLLYRQTEQRICKVYEAL
jgi:hypothetical protein